MRVCVWTFGGLACACEATPRARKESRQLLQCLFVPALRGAVAQSVCVGLADEMLLADVPLSLARPGLAGAISNYPPQLRGTRVDQDNMKVGSGCM